MVNSTSVHPYQQEPTEQNAVILANGIEVNLIIPAREGGRLTADITIDAKHSAGERLIAAQQAMREHATGQLQMAAPILSEDQATERHIGYPVDPAFG